MRLFAASSLLAALAALASAAPSSRTSPATPLLGRDLRAGSAGGPCDLSSEDTNCFLIMDNSGCFLNITNTTKVLGCVDPNPAAAIDIFCRCWGCNGKQLINFMPRLNCSSNSTITVSTNTSTASPVPTGKGAKDKTHMPIPILPHH